MSKSNPDWLEALAAYADRVGQRAAASRVGLSPATINQVLRNKYPGRLDRVAERVREALLGATVNCPILGDALARNVCLQKQDQPFAATNPDRVLLWRACPACPNYRGQCKLED